jgi:hypothetical protein
MHYQIFSSRQPEFNDLPHNVAVGMINLKIEPQNMKQISFEHKNFFTYFLLAGKLSRKSRQVHQKICPPETWG